MKKIICTILIFSFLMTGLGILPASAASNLVLTGSNAYTLLNILGLDLPESTEDSVTRAQFVYTLMQIMSGGNTFPSAAESSFSDIEVTRKECSAVNAALSEGILSPAEQFNPDVAVTPDEALKMLVVACGYALEAGEKGGFPLGYRMTAQQLGLTNNIDISGNTLSFDTFWTLLGNALSIDLRVIRTYGGSTYTYTQQSGHTFLTEYFHLSEVKGIVTANAYTSLYDSEGGREGYIEIDSISYASSGYDSLLGQQVRGFIKDEDGAFSIVYLEAYQNNELSISYQDIVSASSSTIEYLDEQGRIRTINLSSNAVVLYNGKALPKPVIDDFQIQYGALRLIDRGQNNSYDVLEIQSAQTMVVQSIDQRNKQIYDKNSTFMIDASDNDIVLNIILNGETADFSALTENMTITCYVSKDGKYIYLDASDKYISGVLTSYNADENIISVGEEKYEFTPYFEQWYGSSNPGGGTITLFLDSSGRAAAYTTDTSIMKYGYLINAAAISGLSETYLLRIFTSDGVLNEYSLASKVTVDRKPNIQAKQFYEKYAAPGGQVKEQLIRFSVNAENEIRFIDTLYGQEQPDTESTGYWDESMDEYDNLTLYPWRKNTTSGYVYYKTTLESVGSHFFIAPSAPIFIIIDDTDLPDEDRCFLTSSSGLTNDYPFNASALQAYNVSSNGVARAIVYKTDILSKYGLLDANSSKGILNSISYGMNAEGFKILQLDIYTENRTFETFYLEDESLLENLYTDENQEAGELPLAMGDYLRFVADSKNNIINIAKDFDASSLTMLYTRNGENENLRYYFGTAYNGVNNQQLVSSAIDPSLIEDMNTVTYCLKIPTFTVVYDSTLQKIYPASADEIINYIHNPSQADKLLAVTRYVECQVLVIYR